jgi:hypothetical protein
MGWRTRCSRTKHNKAIQKLNTFYTVPAVPTKPKMTYKEATLCTLCVLVTAPCSIPLLCVEHCIQCEKARNGVVPQYPQPIRSCCKNGNNNFTCCCPPVTPINEKPIWLPAFLRYEIQIPFTQAAHPVQNVMGQQGYPKEEIRISIPNVPSVARVPKTPTKRMNSDIYRNL